MTTAAASPARSPPHAQSNPAWMAGSSGGIQAVGPVRWPNGWEYPSPSTRDRAMKKYSYPRWSVLFALTFGRNGGKKR
jgi:hypothetical protein